MIWFGKSFIKFCKSFINLMKLVSTQTSSSARVRVQIQHMTIFYHSVAEPDRDALKLPIRSNVQASLLRRLGNTLCLCSPVLPARAEQESDPKSLLVNFAL